MTPPSSAIDAAIAATEAPQAIEMTQAQITLPPHGRPAILALPSDITMEEALALLTLLPQVVAQARQANPASRLVGPGGQAL